MFKWLDRLGEAPDFESHSKIDSDIIYLDPQDKKFKDKCGSSCILLLKVDGVGNEEVSHYTIQITRDIMELTENNRVQDQIPDK